jgi:hypothetical protein
MALIISPSTITYVLCYTDFCEMFYRIWLYRNIPCCTVQVQSVKSAKIDCIFLVSLLVVLFCSNRNLLGHNVKCTLKYVYVFQSQRKYCIHNNRDFKTRWMSVSHIILVLKLSSASHFISKLYCTYNTLWHKGLNNNEGTAIFLLWSDDRRTWK